MTINEFIQTYINEMLIQAYWYGFWVATSIATLIGITILAVLYFIEKHQKDVDMDEAVTIANSHSN